jgi:mannan endo-1,4-beta-mannosidase
MRIVLHTSLASLALGAALPGGGKKSHGIDQDDFVYVKGLRLYDSKGLHYLTGTYPSCRTLDVNG